MIEFEEIENSLKESVVSLLDEIVEDDFKERSLLSKEEQKMKFQLEFFAFMKTAEQQICNGMQICLNALDQCFYLPMKKEAVIQELYRSFDSMKNIEDMKHSVEKLLKGNSWKLQLSISEECIKSLYHAAKSLFDFKHYDLAEKAFFFLCALDPLQFAFFAALGHSRFFLKDYAKAIDGYGMASLLDPKSTDPHLWAFNCFEKQKEYANAKIALEEAIKCEESNGEPNKRLIEAIKKRQRQLPRNI